MNGYVMVMEGEKRGSEQGAMSEEIRNSKFEIRNPKSRIGVKGFTLIELAIVIAIIGLLFSVTIPVSYRMYMSYQNSLEAQKVLTAISAVRREAFLYSDERYVDARNGLLVVDGKERNEFKDMSISSEGAIVFYKNGTTSGGTVRVKLNEDTFYIRVVGPLGELKMNYGG